jgi:hypothetical protein
MACVDGGGGTGEADLRVIMGRLNAGAGVGAGVFTGGVDGAGVAAADADVDGVGVLDSDEAAGVSNSTGRTLGVAWTLVISLARLQ